MNLYQYLPFFVFLGLFFLHSTKDNTINITDTRRITKTTTDMKMILIIVEDKVSAGGQSSDRQSTVFDGDILMVLEAIDVVLGDLVLSNDVEVDIIVGFSIHS